MLSLSWLALIVMIIVAVLIVIVILIVIALIVLIVIMIVAVLIVMIIVEVVDRAKVGLLSKGLLLLLNLLTTAFDLFQEKRLNAWKQNIRQMP